MTRSFAQRTRRDSSTPQRRRRKAAPGKNRPPLRFGMTVLGLAAGFGMTGVLRSRRKRQRPQVPALLRMAEDLSYRARKWKGRVA